MTTGKTVIPTHHYLTLFTPEEYDDFYGIPKFTQEERSYFFTFSLGDQQLIDSRTTINDEFYCALCLGYFRAKHSLVDFTFDNVSEDCTYLIKTYFNEQKAVPLMPIDYTRIRIQNKILSHEKTVRWKKSHQVTINPLLMELIKRHPKTRPLTKALLHHLFQQNIALPAYSTLQRLISFTLNEEQKRLWEICETKLSTTDQQQLKSLLENDESMYPITSIKQDVKEFTYTELDKEIKKHGLLQPIFNMAHPILVESSLPKETIHYYGSLVNFYNVYKLNRMPQFQAFWYLLCYSFHRYQKINDNLIDFFHYYVNTFHEECKKYSDAEIKAKTLEMDENLVKTGHVLNLITEDNPKHPHTVRKKEAFAILQRDPMRDIAKFLRGETRNAHVFYWDSVDKLTHKIRLYLRKLFLSIDFSTAESSSLDPLITHMKTLLKEPSHFPATDSLIDTFIPKRLHSYMYHINDHEKLLNWGRFEYFFYQLISTQLKSHALSLNHSLAHKSLESELIPTEKWEKEKDQILDSLGFEKLQEPIETLLAEHRKELDTLIISVNQRIESGENNHVNIKKTKQGKRWTLPYQKKMKNVNNPFFLQLPHINIVDILYFVDQRCSFLNAFTPIQSHSIKTKRKDEMVLASIVGNAIRMGTYRMATNANLNLRELLTTEKTYVRLETLRDVIDIINNATAQLPIFPHWDIYGNKHDSLDGSKSETQFDILKARPSPKYYGLGKGVSSFNDILNHLPINARIIGAHEHESTFYFPMVYNNTSTVKATHHSGDGHSINQINFTLFDMIGHHFMPHFPTIQTKKIFSFEPIHLYENMLIRPINQINEALIKSEWPKIQRIIASILMNETSQSSIIRIFSSHDFCSKTKEAFWEYDGILKSLYILHFIDDMDIRKSVRRAINRTEAYHQLCRAIAYLRGGNFKGRTELEIEIWNECSRLIASAIMFYNTYILSQLYEQFKNDEKMIELIIQLSPVAWGHINFTGQFDFSQRQRILEIQQWLQGITVNSPEFIFENV